MRISELSFSVLIKHAKDNQNLQSSALRSNNYFLRRKNIPLCRMPGYLVFESWNMYAFEK